MSQKKYNSGNGFKIQFLLIFFLMQNMFAQQTIEKKDRYTAEIAVYDKTNIFADGTAMNPDKADGVLYIAENGSYFRRRINSYVNVKWFGAKGDADRNDLGTDDTNAIDRALKTIGNIYRGYDLTGGNPMGGATLYFPGGKYQVSKTFVLPNSITVLGESPTSTVIHARKPGFIFTNIGGFFPNGIDMIMNSHITIKNLTLKQGGIEFQGAVSSRIQNIRILNLFGKGADTGISIKLSVDLKISDVKILGSTGYGVLFMETIGSKASTTTTFENLWVAHCNVGMLIDGSDGNLGIVSSKIYNSIFEYNKTGVRVRGKVDNLALRDIHFEQNTVAALEVEGNVNLLMDNLWGDPVGELRISENINRNSDKKIYIRNLNMPYKSNNRLKEKVITQ